MRMRWFVCVLLFAAACLGAGRASAADVEIAGSADAVFEREEAGGISAAVRWVKGDVLVKRAGEVVWEKLEPGMEVNHGDVIETREGATALLAVGDWSYVKPSPMSTVAFQTAKSGDRVFRLVVLENGKMWGSMKRVSEEEDPLVIQLPGGYIDGKEATFFVEADRKDARGCVDMLGGEVYVRSAEFPDQPVPMEKNSRSQIRQGQEVGRPEKIEKAVKENDMNHSCMAGEEKEEEKEELAKKTAAEEEEAGRYVSVTGTASVTYGGGKGEEIVGLPASGEKEKGRQVAVVGKAVVTFAGAEEAAGLTDDDAVEFVLGEAEEDVYEIMEVTSKQEVTFEYPEGEEGAADCRISGVVITSSDPGVEIDGTTVTAYVCGAAAFSIGPTAVACTGGAGFDGWALSVNGGSPSTYGVGARAELSYTSNTTLKLKLYAVSSAEGKKYTPYESLSVNFVKGPGKPAAAISTVGGVAAGGEKIALGPDDLVGGSISVKGDASSVLGCGIKSVRVSADGGSSWSDAAVSGDGSWEYGFAPSEETYYITARAEDERGGVSEDADTVEVEYREAAVGEVAGDCVIDEVEITPVEPDGLEVSDNTISQTACGKARVRVAPSAVSCTGGASYDRWVFTVAGGSSTERGAGEKADWTLEEAGSFDVEIYLLDSGGGREYTVYETEVTYDKDIDPPEVTIAQVGNAAVDDPSEKLSLYSDALEGGYLYVRGGVSSPSECAIEKVRVSMDEGGSWGDATVESGLWDYRVSPAETTYYIMAEAEDEEGGKSEEMFQAVEAEYRHMSTEDDLRNIFDALIQAYLNKDTIGFMDYTSSSFSSDLEGLEDSNLLETSLENKFDAYQTVSLKYKVDTVSVTGEVGRVGFDWSASTGSAGYQYYGTFIFEREDSEWKFSSVEDANTFLRYTSTVKTISLSADETTLIADEADSTTITAEVWDSAQNHVKDGTIISFTAGTGSITASATTEDGIATVTYTAGFTPGTATITATSSNGVIKSISLTLRPEHAPWHPPEPED